MKRQPQARIDLAALRHNLACARRAAPHSRIMAVVKANGYGHDLLRVANPLQPGCDGFAVARAAEGVSLREAGIQLPITVLEGFSDEEELAALAHHQLHAVLHHRHQIELLSAQPLPRPLACWLKIDSGMHRLGLPPEQVAAAAAHLATLPWVAPQVGYMSHLACADDLNDPMTEQQLARFRALVPANARCSLANSAALLGWPATHGDWVRPGILLYGVSPFLHHQGGEHDLRPVMTLTTRLIAINQIASGEPIGYGASWRTPEPMPIGVAAIGYGDGYPRHAPSGTPTLLNGRIAPLVGRVSMDMITLDLRHHPDARIGDRVTLWGEGLPIEQVASQAGTIAYELLCGVTRRVVMEFFG